MTFLLVTVGAAIAVGVELLEALAIVLAVGSTRRWPDALAGAAAGVAACAVLAAFLGPVLATVDLTTLRLTIGVLLLVFGLEWLRKGTLRRAGRRSRASSRAEYDKTREELEDDPMPPEGRPDWAGRLVAFKGVLLEGIEVVVIVTALASRPSGPVPALLGAGVATAATVGAAIVLRAPLSRIPETELKWGVGASAPSGATSTAAPWRRSPLAIAAATRGSSSASRTRTSELRASRRVPSARAARVPHAPAIDVVGASCAVGWEGDLLRAQPGPRRHRSGELGVHPGHPAERRPQQPDPGGGRDGHGGGGEANSGHGEILMLTAARGTSDLVTGLALGADDYLAKPFRWEELVARVHALARRAGAARPALRRTVPAQYADSVLAQLGSQYALALAGAALLACGIGWAAAGSALAPLRRIAVTARSVSQDRLDARVQMEHAPDDEVREVAVAFDAMLDRVAAGVEAQQRFVANASHELRTPLTVIRTGAEVVLEDPDATRGELRAVLREAVETTERTEGLLEGLLVLAALGAGDRPGRALADDPVDLGAVAERAVGAAEPAAAAAGVALRAEVESAPVRGDTALLERLVGNLVDNAIRHGAPGPVEVAASAQVGGGARLRVASGGPRIAADQLVRLTQPFERLQRASRARGTGLGLSIVRAVAEAHGGALELRAPAAGGLTAEVVLPPGPEEQLGDPGARRGPTVTEG